MSSGKFGISIERQSEAGHLLRWKTAGVADGNSRKRESRFGNLTRHEAVAGPRSASVRQAAEFSSFQPISGIFRSMRRGEIW